MEKERKELGSEEQPCEHWGCLRGGGAAPGVGQGLLWRLRRCHDGAGVHWGKGVKFASISYRPNLF